MAPGKRISIREAVTRVTAQLETLCYLATSTGAKGNKVGGPSRIEPVVPAI